MVILWGKRKNLTTPLTILGQNVGEKFLYIYQDKKDTYLWGKTRKFNHPHPNSVKNTYE
jgi:hypothetical protein